MGGEGWGDWVKKHWAGMNRINGIRIFLFVEGGALLTGDALGLGVRLWTAAPPIPISRRDLIPIFGGSELRGMFRVRGYADHVIFE